MTSGLDVRCALAAAAVNGTVVLTATDASPEFEELLHNWACHVSRVGIQPLVWALDEATHHKLQARRWIRSIFSSEVRLPESARPNAYKKPSSDEYTMAVALKPIVMLKVLRHGFNVLFLDVDIALSGDPRPWLCRSPAADLQISLNYDDRPQQQRVTGVPDLNTGVLHARRSSGTIALVEQWAARTSARHGCSRRPPLWSCGDQEQLTKLLRGQCRWQPLSFEAAARLDAVNDVQSLECGGTIGALRVEVLPPRRFASGQTGGLWRRRSVAPAEVLTFHANFGGFAGGSKKAALRNLRFESTRGGSAWCAD